MKSEKAELRPLRVTLIGLLVLALGIFSIGMGVSALFLGDRLSEDWALQLWVSFATKGLVMLKGTAAIIDIFIGVVFVIGGYLIIKVRHLELGALLTAGTGLISVFVFGVGGWATEIGGVKYEGLGVVFLRLVLQALVPIVAGGFSLTMEREEAKTVMGRRIRGFWEDFSHNKIGLVGVAIVSAYIAAAVLVPVLSLGISPDKTDLADSLVPPEWMAVIDPSLNNLPRSTVYNLNLTLDDSSIPEFIRESPSFNVTSDADTTIISFDGVTFPENRSIVMVFNSDSFSYPYAPPQGAGFVIELRVPVDTNHYSLIQREDGTNVTVATSRALFNVEVNFTNPVETYSVWDAEWSIKKLIYYAASLDQMMRVMPLHLPPAQDRLIKGKQTVSAALSSDLYWIHRMGYMDVNGHADHHGVARALFSTPGNYSLRMYVYVAPTTSFGRLQPVSFAFKISPIKVTIFGLLWGVMGTTHLGQDVWARVVYGVRISLAIGLSSAVLATLLGIVVGVVAGYVGGMVDEFLMRIVDILLCLPSLPLLMVLVHMYGRNVWYIVILIAVFGWLGLSRVLRSQVLSLREAPFIESATASGGSRAYIMFRHLVPNVLPVVLADFVLSVPAAIMLEAALSFIGFGDPSTPTWGREFNIMWSEGGAFVNFSWWWILPPGIAITLLCLAFVFLGHAVDEIVNPRLRRRR